MGGARSKNDTAAKAEITSDTKPAVKGSLGLLGDTELRPIWNNRPTPHTARFRRHRFDVDPHHGSRFEFDLRARVTEYPACNCGNQGFMCHCQNGSLGAIRPQFLPRVL